MSTALKNNTITQQDYLAGELLSDIRHEYIDGEVYAMAGAHKDYNIISMTKLLNVKLIVK